MLRTAVLETELERNFTLTIMTMNGAFLYFVAGKTQDRFKTYLTTKINLQHYMFTTLYYTSFGATYKTE